MDFADDLEDKVAAMEMAVKYGAKLEFVKSIHSQFDKIEEKARRMSGNCRAQKRDRERRIYNTLSEQAGEAKAACEAMIDMNG